MRPIDADELKKKAVTALYQKQGMTKFLYEGSFVSLEEIDKMPTIEVDAIHGEWKISKKEFIPTDKFVCSVCDGLVIVSTFRNRCMYKYCPNCGAKIEG